MRADEPLFSRPSSASARRGTALRGARLSVYGVEAGAGCAGRYYLVGPLAWVCADGVQASNAPPGAPLETIAQGLPNRYFFVSPDGSFGYKNLATAEDGVPDTQLQPGFGVAVTSIAEKPGSADPFGLTTRSVWVPMRDLRGPIVAPARLGAELDGSEFAWIIAERATLHATPGGARRSALPARLSRVPVLERAERRGVLWLRVGDGDWIRAADTTGFRQVAPPAEARADERWIDVDLERQVVTAYRGVLPLFATLVSTGRGTPGSEQATPTGVYRIWVKLRSSDMDNLENLEANTNYAIQAVPWVMYFHRGYGLHGAFWHRAFGRVQSHGCVNIVPEDAHRLFEWSSPRLPPGWSAVFPTDYEPGTLVSVR